MPYFYFIVYAPDCTDDGVSQRRQEVQKAHLEAIMGNPALRVGGGMLSPKNCLDTPDAKKEMKQVGSLMIMEASSYAEVEDMIKTDVYYTGNVWDVEKLSIIPWVSPTPLPVPPPLPVPSTPAPEPKKESAEESK